MQEKQRPLDELQRDIALLTDRVKWTARGMVMLGVSVFGAAIGYYSELKDQRVYNDRQLQISEMNNLRQLADVAEEILVLLARLVLPRQVLPLILPILLLSRSKTLTRQTMSG